jgi:hypothetical protein
MPAARVPPWLKEPLADRTSERHHFGVEPAVDKEAVTIVMTILADIREDVKRIRRELVDDDGEEEEEDS